MHEASGFGTTTALGGKKRWREVWGAMLMCTIDRRRMPYSVRLQCWPGMLMEAHFSHAISSVLWGAVQCSCTVIRLVWVSAKFGICTVVTVNGTLVEAKMCTFTLESTHFIFNQCPIYTHDGASAKFRTNSQETDNSVCGIKSSFWITPYGSVSSVVSSTLSTGLRIGLSFCSFSRDDVTIRQYHPHRPLLHFTGGGGGGGWERTQDKKAS